MQMILVWEILSHTVAISLTAEKKLKIKDLWATYGPLYYKRSERDKLQAFQYSNHNFDVYLVPSKNGRGELQRTINITEQATCYINWAELD